MLTQLLGTLTLQPQPATSAPIAVRNFVDIDMDVEGWYALGHHDPKPFFAAVSNHEMSEQLERNDVEYLWAIFADNNFELFNEPAPGASPVTIVRLF